MGFERVTLGRTGLSVSPIGIASSYGTNEAMVEEAVDRGVNYLYWGAQKTQQMGRGIQRVVRRKRDDLVIVAHTTTRRPSVPWTFIVNGSTTAIGSSAAPIFDDPTGG